MARRLFSMVAAGALICAGGWTVKAATVQVPESWAGGVLNGWTNWNLSATPAPLTVESQALKVVFAPGLFFYSTVVVASTNASSGRFIGDYLAGGVADITFKLNCVYELDAETNAPAMQLRFRNDQTGRLWQHPITGIQTGVWTTVTVPIEYALFSTESSNSEWSAFLEDARSMSWVGISFERNVPTKTDVFRLDDFELLGPGLPYASWIQQFPEGTGLGGRHRFPHGDLDADGVSNWDEWIAGTSADDSSDLPRLSIDVSGAPLEPVRLNWDMKTQRRYSLSRATSVAGVFGLVGTNLATNTYVDATATNATPYFYRLAVTLED